jgi:hypothetical protein
VERADYAREAVTLLAQIVTEHKGPLMADLAAVEPVVALALHQAQTAPAAAVALGDVPNPDAQRTLADVALDPSQAPAIRKQSATELVRSIRRYGRLITADQEAKLAAILREETDPEARSNLLTIFHALIPASPTQLPKPFIPPVPGESSAPVQTTPSTVITPPTQPEANP